MEFSTCGVRSELRKVPIVEHFGFAFWIRDGQLVSVFHLTVIQVTRRS